MRKTACQQRQVDVLRRYLENVVIPFSPHYRGVFERACLRPDAIRTWDDLRRIPFTSKVDLLTTPLQPNRSRELILTPDPNVLRHRPSTIARALLHGRRAVEAGFEREFRPLMMTATTGRSAEPVAVVYTARDLQHLATAGYRVMRVCGAEKEQRMINMFPYAPHLAFWITHYAASEFGVFMLSTGGGKVMGTEGNVRAIARIDPHVLIGIPTFVYHVLQQALENGTRMPSLRKIVLGGEKAPAGMRRKLRALAQQLGAGPLDILLTYAFTEAKTAWAECPHAHGEPSHGYHLYPDLGIVEIVDPRTGEPVPEGMPGEIVHTPLDARGTVILRYRTGDCTDGGIVHGPCPGCGRVVPRLTGSLSRTSEVKEMHLDKLKGTLVDFNELEHILDDADNIGAWQLELRKVNDDPLELDELILHVHSTDSNHDQIEGELMRRFAERLELRPNRVEFHSGSEMRELQGVGSELKEKRIADHRPKNEQTSPQP